MMPKRGSSYKPRNNWTGPARSGKFQNEHDERGNDTTRRVSFKPNKDRHGSKHRNLELSVRTHLGDDDIDMNGGVYPRFQYGRGGFRGGRGRRGGNGRNSPAPRGQYVFRKLLPNPSGWYLVQILHAPKYEKETIIRELLNAVSPDVFVPLYYKTEGNWGIFYVDDFKIAEKIQLCDRKPTMPDGHPMILKVRSSQPQIILDENIREKMKLAMAKRYKPDAKALNLSRFHADPELVDHFCPLSRPTIFTAVIDIIADNIPELEALNLDNNSIYLLDHMKCLQQKLRHIKILHLKDNRIHNFLTMESLKGLPITELVLEGNPVKTKIKDNNIYVSNIRRHFPKILKLDGVDLPPKISFDVSESNEVPSSKASFLCAVEGGDMVRQFLQQYFMLYDSDNRQPLLDAYHEHAMFSLTTPSQNRPSEYTRYNRNLLRTRDSESRFRSLKRGRLEIVTFLSNLPKTKHDPISFTVDLSMFMPQLVLLTVSGIFRELDTSQKGEPLRHFQRILVIVPSGSGFCIKNEQIIIANTTQEQENEAFRTPSDMLTPGAATTVASSSIPLDPGLLIPEASTSAVPDITKQQMIQAISSQSKMNFEWSQKCLVETNWDFQRAMFVFSELNKQGNVPAEAFV